MRPCPAHLVEWAEPTDERLATVSPQHWASLLAVGWAGRLRTPSGQTRFQIHYSGDLFEEAIVEDDNAPALIYAVAADSGESIVLFDGAAHGYNVVFCDEHDADKLAARRANQRYVDADGESTFEIQVWAGYNIELEPPVFDAFLAVATNGSGRATEVVNEELA